MKAVFKTDATMFGDKGVLIILFGHLYFFRSRQRFRWIFDIL